MYGTSIDQMEKISEAGKIPILDIDINGAEKFLESYPESNTIFIFSPSIESLKARLIKRETETKASLNLRLENSKIETCRALA